MNNTTCTNIDFNSDVVFLPVLYGFVFCIGLPINLLALYGLYCMIKSENILPVFVINLLLSDLLQILTLPLWIDYYRKGHKWNFGGVSCPVSGVMYWINQTTNTFFIVTISLERYVAVVHPLRFQSHQKLRNSCLICISAWLSISLLTSIAYFLGFDQSAKEGLCLESYPSEKAYTIFRLITLTFTFPLPLLVLLILHDKTRKVINKSLSVPENEKKRIKRLFCVVLFIFVIGLGPYHATCYVKFVGVLFSDNICNFEAKMFLYFQISLGLLSFNNLMDPILYIFVCKDVRKELSGVFNCLNRYHNNVK
ncbi:G-protein coupled receptor 4-like [Erpetoichthys calabaricus]|uniref:G-protein coupled receptor 4-like n=1 Tax=Erpetoichthys calabaricus TaxID=27687 RepID=UPI002234661E|nr:G-protein coupled receptor 4-like [Erpetoichthys calabaricus]